MPVNEAFLSLKEKHDLARYVAGVGENYDRYVIYANKRGWRVFTKSTFKNWVQRHRRWVRKYREQHVEELRKISMYDREKRIQDLEDSVNVVNSHLMAANSEHSPHECRTCGMAHEIAGPEVAIKLLLAKSKLLEQIAKERNEWMKPVDEVQQNDARSLLGLAAMEIITQARQATITDGKVVVVDD